MLSHAGKEAREVYKTLPWATNGDDKKFDKVIEAFRNYCSPRKHILYERYMFWSTVKLLQPKIRFHSEPKMIILTERLHVIKNSTHEINNSWP